MPMDQDPTLMASSTALKLAKKELRSLMKQKLKAISSESITTQSAAVTKSITGLKSYQNSKRIGIYLSMPNGEVQTDAIVRHAIESGKKVFVPYLHKAFNPPPDTPKSVMDMVDLQSMVDYTTLKRDSWGIPTIGADTVAEREHILESVARKEPGLDLILMPGVAFEVDSENGFVRRLGHGKGFYDYFLHRYQQSQGTQVSIRTPGNDVLLYGLALEEQFAQAETGQSVPVGEHDHFLHGVFVGDGRIVEGPIER